MADIKPQDLPRERALMKIRIYLSTLILYTLLWWRSYFSNLLYLFTIVVTSTHVLILCLVIKQSKLVQPINALFIGLIPASMAFLMPNNLLFAITVQFMSLNYGLNELGWQHMPILFGGNALTWIACYLYYTSQGSSEPEILAVKNFLQDRSQVGQILLGFVMYYFNLMLLSADKHMNLQTQKQYESRLLKLNTDLEAANSKLQRSNEELQEALEEKENFILRFSHEIRNPLNSLLGNIELCYEQTTDKELEQMLKDAKVSGEILLQLLNNVLDTAKVATGRLEVSLSTQKVRQFLERAWVICSEIIRKRKLYGCLSVNMNVPEVLEFDHHRLMQILINTVSNAAKFTDQGHVKVFVDFIVGSEISKEDMLPKYGILPQSQDRKFKKSLNGDDTEEKSMSFFEEKPNIYFESLTLRGRKHFKVNPDAFLQTQASPLKIPLFTGNFMGKCENQQINTRKTDNSLKKPMGCHRTPKEGYIRFEITDTGCGISKQYLENVFKKFHQANNSSTSKRQIGTGLGLWITKEIIEKMEGSIEVFSQQNKGTTIVIMVKSKSAPLPPLHLSVSLPTFSIQHIPNNSPRSGRVLIVEDIIYNQELNKKFFIKCGVEKTSITIANNGKEAVDLFLSKEPQHFDLILMDIDMPIMDGKKAVQIIRKEEKKRGWRPVNIVFLTGFAEARTQKELVDERGEYRANGFYSKPASVDTFKRIVKNFMSSSNEAHTIEDEFFDFPHTEGSPRRFPKNQINDRLVLVVDDDSFNLEMITKMLKLCKINTIEARNGEEAIRVYEENWKRISCILMDCEMPVLDGLEATQRILAKHAQRGALSGKRMNIYGLTGHVGKEYRQKCLDVGMKDILEKPINIEVLSTLLKDNIPK